MVEPKENFVISRLELSYFRPSLSTSSVLELFLDESHTLSIVDPDPLIDFFFQPPDIFDTSLRSTSNEQVKDEQVKDELSNFEPGPLLLLCLKILHKIFHLVTQLG